MTVYLTWFHERFRVLLADTTKETVHIYAQAYIMILLSTQLFGDKNGNRVHLRWLPFVAKLEEMGKYNWVSAALAWFTNACVGKLSSTLSVAGLHFGAAPIAPPQPSLLHSQSASPHHHEIEVLSDLAVQISHFPTIFKRSVNRPQHSVATVIALEPATLASDSKAHQQLHNEARAPGHK
ncbi:hypothetical protein Ahy_B05g075968 [Arachis hypogaea]|uniref:Aminotransferase-like plant mobile domain-containing protein n=1 Tax=Arachis hypogaea TaxID=3818 RepID=A0A444Z2A5_ARAHY|nr:hypothetical protein Ahy_B05g075968 [Arachis hypogaea]